MRKILLTSDGAGAWCAADAVVDLIAAAQSPVEVEVLHVSEVEYDERSAGPGGHEVFPERRQQVDDLVAELRRRGVTAWGKVRAGIYDDVADDIVDEATSEDVGLIAMSCRPRSRLRYAFTGSVSQTVIMRAGCPVMVVREPGSEV